MAEELVPIQEYEYKELLRQSVALLPWSHNLLLMQRKIGWMWSWHLKV